MALFIKIEKFTSKTKELSPQVRKRYIQKQAASLTLMAQPDFDKKFLELS